MPLIINSLGGGRTYTRHKQYLFLESRHAGLWPVRLV